MARETGIANIQFGEIEVMKHRFSILAFTLAIVGGSFAHAENITSGFQVGECIAGLKVIQCTSTAAGQEL